MATLNPAPTQLGLASPALGAWFSEPTILPVPTEDLSLELTMETGTNWLPPTAGFLSFFISTPTRPAGLAALRQADGTPAFEDNRVIALFRLLSEAEERLNGLMRIVPAADTGVAGAVPSRSRVRYFAVELPDFASNIGALLGMVHPAFPPLTHDPEQTLEQARAAHIGLKMEADGTLTNGMTPMFDLKRPGGFQGANEIILQFPTPLTIKFWAFDQRGRAIDPGAVAEWWRFLTAGVGNVEPTAFDNLLAEGVNALGVTSDAQLTVQLVNAHEGTVLPELLARVTATNLDGTGVVRRYTGNTAAAQLGFSPPAADTPDDAPLPRMALLPTGTYAETLTLFPTGPVNALLLTRDFVRVAVLDVEEELVGQKRVSSAAPGSSATRRAEDQNRTSTRVLVGRTAPGALFTTTDGAISAAVALMAGTGTTDIVTPVLDREWGGLAALTLPDVAAPVSLPPITATALAGAGTATDEIVRGQRVLIEMTLNIAFAGAWIRGWSQGFDLETGRHFRLDGGGGLVRADGTVAFVVPLPDGDVTPAAPLGVHIGMVTQRGMRLYTEQRFERPVPVGGFPVAIGNVTGQVLICETGQVLAANALNGVIPSGATLVARDAAGAALIDRASLPATAFTTDTLAQTIGVGDRIEITQPAFRNMREGDAIVSLVGSGVSINRQTRQGLVALVGPGSPLPTMERLEGAVLQTDGNVLQAVVTTTPALGRNHELLPHKEGHPGAPAGVEIHGTGVRLTGTSTVGVAEMLRDRLQKGTVDLITSAFTTLIPAPADPPAPSLFAVPLRTVAAGVEGELALATAIVEGEIGFPFEDILRDQGVAQAFAQIDQAVTTIDPNNTLNLDGLPSELATSVVRAMDRRFIIGARGAREGATSLIAAIQRAEDFIYIETPALDDSILGEQGDELALWQALKERMEVRPALCVIFCIPVHPLPGTPAALTRVRNDLLIRAFQSLVSGTGAPGSTRNAARIAVFAPTAGPGRTLRLAATTVIVDDVYAFTGTTHLWRRGLSFDSSLAVALFDERLTDGRPSEIQQFRRALLAGRLGLAEALVPDEPTDLVKSIQVLVERGGGGRVTELDIELPTPLPSDTDRDVWNRDGSPQEGFNPIAWLIGLTAEIRAQLEEEASPAP